MIPKYLFSWAMGKISQGLRVRLGPVTKATGVRVIEVLLHLEINP